MAKETGRPGSGTRDLGKGGPNEKRGSETQAEASRRVIEMKRGIARENGQTPQTG